MTHPDGAPRTPPRRGRCRRLLFHGPGTGVEQLPEEGRNAPLDDAARNRLPNLRRRGFRARISLAKQS